jgi:predicted transcriptional regulator
MPRIKGRKPMRETAYRASRVCRVLGNPLAYTLVHAIGSGVRTPTDLSRATGASLVAVSITLRHLRQIDVVRYETDANRKRYWLKHPELLVVLGRLERTVDRMRRTRE